MLTLFSGEEPNEEAQQTVQKLKEAYPDLIAFHDLRLLAETKALYETFGMKKQGYYFVRPDCHIAYRSASLDTHHFSAYLERFLLREKPMEAFSPLVNPNIERLTRSFAEHEGKKKQSDELGQTGFDAKNGERI